jgi:hypothetical protein
MLKNVESHPAQVKNVLCISSKKFKFSLYCSFFMLVPNQRFEYKQIVSVKWNNWLGWRGLNCALLAPPPYLQCWGSVTFWCGAGSGSPDPYLWLMDPVPDRDPTLNTTPFFIVLRMQKIFLFSYFFLITCPQAHHLQSKNFNYLLKFYVTILFCRHYFGQSAKGRIRSRIRIPTSD